MSASTGPDLELSEKLLKILNLQADTALKEAQLRNQQAQLDLQSANLHVDTALKEAQLRNQRAQVDLQPANLQADTALKMRQAAWEPWKAVAVAMAAGGALVGGLITVIAALMRAGGRGL